MLETKKTPLTPSCVLAAGFVSQETLGEGKVMIWGKPQDLKRSVVMSLFDGTKFAVMAQLTDGVFLLVFRKN